MKVVKKTIVVTGAGSGMGREITLELVRRGAKVAATDLNPTTVEKTKQLAGKNVETFIFDVTDRETIKKLPSRVIGAFGSVDGLINNAGIIQPFVKVADMTREQVEKIMNVNFYGPLDLMQAFLPELSKRKQAHILNVSSMGAYAPVPGQSVYGASKAALKLLTEGLRSELMDTNIGVTVAFPGAVATNITTNSGVEISFDAGQQQSKFKTMPATEAAKVMVDAIENDKPRVTVGKDATFMDRYSRFSPIGAANLIYKQMKNLLG